MITTQEYRAYLTGRIRERIAGLLSNLDTFESIGLARLANRLDVAAKQATTRQAGAHLANVLRHLNHMAEKRNPDRFAIYRNRLIDIYAGQEWQKRYTDAEALAFVPPDIRGYLKRLERKLGRVDYREPWFKLLDFYGHTCLCCGIHAQDTPEGGLTRDHIKPRALGGTDHISNIQPLCRACNALKADNEIDLRTSVPDWF